MLISDDYRALNAEIHGKSASWGIIKRSTIDHLLRYLEEIQAESILDYGCGKGRLGKMMHRVTSYDPGVPEFSAPVVGFFDMVVCTAVMEHVEPDSVDHVLDELKARARKMVYLVIDTQASSYTLSDGRNAHLTQATLDWWLPQLMKRWNVRAIDVGHRAFTFIGKV